MNYGTLKTSVANYLHRTDLTAIIPDFIDQARTRLGADLRALANLTTGTVTSFSSSRTALPTNLAKLIGVTLADVPLLEVQPDQVFNYSGGVYAVDGQDLVVPGAGSSTSVLLHYYSVPAALVNNGDVSVPMVQFPQLWIYAAVAEGALYCQDYELAGVMNAAYAELIRIANRSGDEARQVAPVMVSDQPMIQSMAQL